METDADWQAIKSLKRMVARDGLELPPAFSGPPAKLAKWLKVYTNDVEGFMIYRFRMVWLDLGCCQSADVCVLYARQAEQILDVRLGDCKL